MHVIRDGDCTSRRPLIIGAPLLFRLYPSGLTNSSPNQTLFRRLINYLIKNKNVGMSIVAPLTPGPVMHSVYMTLFPLDRLLKPVPVIYT